MYSSDRSTLKDCVDLCGESIKSIFLQVVEAPDDVADGAALCAFQYFENIRNFLVAVEELGLPSFEASDMEKVENSEVLKKMQTSSFSIIDLL